MTLRRLDVEGGKYTIVVGSDPAAVGSWRFEALRHGEPWVNFCGPDGYAASKMWLAVVHELEHLREVEAKAKAVTSAADAADGHGLKKAIDALREAFRDEG